MQATRASEDCCAIGVDVNCDEYREWVAGDVDGVLGALSAEARAHVEKCARCGAERERQLAVRSLLRSRDLHLAPPVGLRTRVLAALEEAALEEPARRWWRSFHWIGAVAVGVVALAVVVLWNRDTAFAPLIREYDRAAEGALTIALRTSQPQDLEAFYHQHAAEGIPVHVVDLSRAGFRLVGGTLDDFPGRRARITVYSDGRYTIVCDYRFAEHFPFALPATGEPVFFGRSGANFCAHRAGDEVCVLVTRMPMELFRAKLAGGGPSSG